MKSYILKIDGMGCPMCETHVNDIAYKTGFVKKAKSSYRKGTLMIKTDAVNLEPLAKALEAQGYKVVSTEETD